MVTYLHSIQHSMCESVCIFLATKVESINLLVVPPLMECSRGLVVLQTLENNTIDHNLLSEREMWIKKKKSVDMPQHAMKAIFTVNFDTEFLLRTQ